MLPRLLARLSIQLTEDQTAKWVGRIIPGVGAIVGGSIDYAFLRRAGQRATGYYHNRYLTEHGLAAPAATAALPPGPVASGQIVEGSLAAPVAPTAPTMPPAMAPTAPVAPRQAAAASMVPLEHRTNPPVGVPRRHRRPPERVAISLGIFALLFFLLTAGACAALVYLVVQALPH